MKRINYLFTTLLILVATSTFAQAPLKEYTAGHVFYISLPEYMSRTTGLNSASSIQFKNAIKDVYGFIIEDNKDEMKIAEIYFSSVNEFYDDFIKDFLAGEKKRKVSPPVYQSIGENNFAESDVSYYDKDAKTEIYYFTGIAETPSAYYKVLCWTTLANKEKFKADFQKIFYSLRD